MAQETREERIERGGPYQKPKLVFRAVVTAVRFVCLFVISMLIPFFLLFLLSPVLNSSGDDFVHPLVIIGILLLGIYLSLKFVALWSRLR